MNKLVKLKIMAFYVATWIGILSGLSFIRFVETDYLGFVLAAALSLLHIWVISMIFKKHFLVISEGKDK